MPLLFFTKNQDMKRYVKVSHDIITETSISIGARLVLIYLNSKPQDWQFYMQDIATQLGISYKLTQKYVKELESEGFLLRKREQKNGVFWYSWKASNSTTTRVTVTPFTVSGDTVSGDTVSGDTVSGDTVSGKRGSILIIEETNNDITNNKITKNKRIAQSRALKKSDQGFSLPVREMEQVFQEHQEKHFARPLDFDGKEWKNLERIGDKLAAKIKEHGHELTKEKLINWFDRFLQKSAECSNNWYLNNHFTPSGLNSQFLKIINTKDNETKKGHSYTEDGLLEAARRVGERLGRDEQIDGVK